MPSWLLLRYPPMEAPARVLIDLATWRLAGDPQADTHPWRLVAPGAAAVLERASGVRVPAVPSISLG